jgi:cell division protein FtsI/penicillin-binding protein 2
MSEYTKSFSRRALVVYIMALLFGICCLYKILNLTISQRSFFSGKDCVDITLNPLAKDTNCRCFVKKDDIAPMRGDIYDDDGNILASDFTVFDVVIDGPKLKPVTKINKKGEKCIDDTLYV